MQISRFGAVSQKEVACAIGESGAERRVARDADIELRLA
jgi:hypothetical protein